MIANYHTHTYRCHHAQGTDREYIEIGIQRGLKTLGFSDHVPYPFPGGYESGYRVRRNMLSDYVHSLQSLRQEYKDRIEILIGFEAEYYPLYFNDMLEELNEYGYDYLIMGQHFVDNEIDSNLYCYQPLSNKTLLHKYVYQVMEGLSTGKYLYLAHPDLIGGCVDESYYISEMTVLCEFVKQNKIPLEINGLGISSGRCYPNETFYNIAADVGCNVILGSDAHNPDAVANPETIKKSLAFAKKLGLNVLESLDVFKF